MFLQNASSNSTISYDSGGLILVSGLFGLLGFLFWLMLRYSHRLDQTSYLAQLYSAALSSVERRRLASPVEEEWEKGRYHERTIQDNQWLDKNRPPEPPSEISQENRIRRARQSLLETGRIGTSPPGLGSASEDIEPQIRLYLVTLGDWQRDTLHSEARRRYKDDLHKKELEADRMATQALGSIDLATLRGQGPHFVLQFTAVVVIIFATAALAILGKLESQQAGTILAAIAGYVLGQAAARISQQTAQESTKVSRTPTNEAKNQQEGG
jgi:hypothetical protein